eukprot:75243_1
MFSARKTATSTCFKCTQPFYAALTHYQYYYKTTSLNHVSLFSNHKSHPTNYNLNFLSISNFTSNTNNVSIDTQPTRPTKPSVKDPIITGLKVNLTESDGSLIPSLEDIEISKLELSEKFGFELRDLRALQKRRLQT